MHASFNQDQVSCCTNVKLQAAGLLSEIHTIPLKISKYSNRAVSDSNNNITVKLVYYSSKAVK